MDQPNPNHWRNMFERGGTPPKQGQNGHAAAGPFGGLDDGYQPPPPGADGRASLSHEEITDEAAMALALDPAEYRPWILQRGRGHPPLMLHLRRYEPKSGLWQGWQVSYPHLIAVEYTGDTLLSLDFGTRQFVIEGRGFGELIRHLQSGTVLLLQEYAPVVWPNGAGIASIHAISCIG